MQIVWFDDDIADLDLVVAAPEFLLDFGGRDGHAIGNEFAEFLLEQSLANDIFKFRHPHSRGGFHLGGILIVTDEGAAGKCGGNQLANAVDAFLVADGDAELLGFGF